MSGASRILSATDGMCRVDLNFAGVGFDFVYNILVATSPAHQIENEERLYLCLSVTLKLYITIKYHA